MTVVEISSCGLTPAGCEFTVHHSGYISTRGWDSIWIVEMPEAGTAFGSFKYPRLGTMQAYDQLTLQQAQPLGNSFVPSSQAGNSTVSAENAIETGHKLTLEALQVANLAGRCRPLFVCSIGFEELAQHLGLEQPMYGIDLPTWHSLDMVNPQTAIQDLAARYLGMVRAIQPTGPYRMFGYEEGAILVFELALQLQAKGEEIAFLGMFDAPRVGPPQRRSWTRLIRYHGRMLSQLPLAGWWPHLYHHIFQHRLTRMFTKLALRLAQYRPAPPPPVQQAKQPVVGQNTSLIQWLRILRLYQPNRFRGRLALLFGAILPPTSGWKRVGMSGPTRERMSY